MSRPLHKSWTTWVGLALMLAAIATYVATLDDSTEPLDTPPASDEGGP